MEWQKHYWKAEKKWCLTIFATLNVERKKQFGVCQKGNFLCKGLQVALKPMTILQGHPIFKICPQQMSYSVTFNMLKVPCVLQCTIAKLMNFTFLTLSCNIRLLNDVLLTKPISIFQVSRDSSEKRKHRGPEKLDFWCVAVKKHLRFVLKKSIIISQHLLIYHLSFHEDSK